MNYDTLKDKATVERTIESLKTKNVIGVHVKDGAEALEKIKSLIPKGASVMNGTSKTLEEIGYVEYLKSGKHGWNNLHEMVLAEKDPMKQSVLRKQATISDFYLGSVHAVAETGEFVIASASGSQLPGIVFNSNNLIFVVSTKKIVPTLEEALKRVKDYVFPQEDARMKSVGYGGSLLAKILIFANELSVMGRKVYVIFIDQKLGF